MLRSFTIQPTPGVCKGFSGIEKMSIPTSYSCTPGVPDDLQTATTQLRQAAEYLDAVDGGLTPPEPEGYQAAAAKAEQILRRYHHLPDFQSQCGRSWALGEILENILSESSGTVQDAP